MAHPLLWRGQNGGSAGTAAVATGFAALDRYLPGGGWPLTGISEIFIERYGLGELSVLMPALAALSRRTAHGRQWIVWIAPPFVPYAPALVQHGIDLSRVLLVHPSVSGSSAKEALWAVEQVIRSQSSVAALAWVKQADVAALRRLQLGAEAHRCWTVLFRPLAAMIQHSPAALRFKLSSAAVVPESGATESGTTESMRTGAGDETGIRIEIQKCRGRKPRTFVL